jgi:hypothetical protein
MRERKRVCALVRACVGARARVRVFLGTRHASLLQRAEYDAQRDWQFPLISRYLTYVSPLGLGLPATSGGRTRVPTAVDARSGVKRK